MPVTRQGARTCRADDAIASAIGLVAQLAPHYYFNRRDNRPMPYHLFELTLASISKAYDAELDLSLGDMERRRLDHREYLSRAERLYR